MASSEPPVPPSPPLPDAADLINFVVNQGSGVTGLSQTNLKSVPTQYIQPPQERLDMNKVVEFSSIPIIDVSNWDDPEVGKSICAAATHFGFFQIVNHGVPLEVMEGVKEATHLFFQLPVEERKKYLKGSSPSDTIELKTSFSPSNEKVLEWKDVLFHVYSTEDKSSKDWPAVSRDQVLEYMKWAKPLIKNILEVLLRGLNVKDIDGSKESMLMGTLIVNLLHYPACPNPGLTAGAGRHSDISTITVLLQDDVGGLYVRGIDDDSWIHVTPVEEAFVINIGDVLQILSNDRYKSIEHRVIVDDKRSRVSIPIFVNPAPGEVIGPLREALDCGEKPIYKPVKYFDYYNYFFSKAHDGKQTIDFAKI